MSLTPRALSILAPIGAYECKFIPFIPFIVSEKDLWP